jgi:Asp/Glu/hydantoin racemase
LSLRRAAVYDRPVVPIVLLVNPNTTAAVTQAILERAREAARPGTELRAVTAPFGAPYVMTREDNRTAAQAALAALAAHATGCDGAVIAAFSDPGLAEARARLPVPVVGIAEAAMLTACMLGARFSILTIAPRLASVFRELAEGYGLGSRLASVRALDWPAQDVIRRPDAVADALVALGQAAVTRDDAQVLILGGAPLARLHERMAGRVDAPLLDGVGCAVRQVELLVSLEARRPAERPS